MVERTFGDLVRDLRARRTAGDKPPVLLLGAGASIDAGIASMPELYPIFGATDYDSFLKSIGQATAAERYRYLSQFLQNRKPEEITSGYQALARLCAEKVFDVVLTTNLDPLLDDALAGAQLWRKDYLLIVNGVIRADRFDLILRSELPRVKVVKLHGDLFQRFMAWTIEEMDTYLTEIAPSLKPAIAGRDVLVVGHSLHDERIRDLAESTGGALWYTNPVRVPDYLAGNQAMRTVLAPEVAFERLFPELARELLLESHPSARKREAPVPARVATADAAAAPGAQTMDDLLASVLAVSGPGGVPSSTAFVLQEPRVIVADAYAVAPLLGGGQTPTLELIDHNGRHSYARLLRRHEAHPFGPVLLEVPDDLRATGLRVDTSPIQPGEVVQVAVAAGDKIGVSTGAAVSTIDATIRIQEVGLVRDLATLNAVVRAGSSGAPVVDRAMALRGFIVAGSESETNPTSVMYPCAYWMDFILGRERRARSGPRRKARSRRGTAKKRRPKK